MIIVCSPFLFLLLSQEERRRVCLTRNREIKIFFFSSGGRQRRSFGDSLSSKTFFFLWTTTRVRASWFLFHFYWSVNILVVSSWIVELCSCCFYYYLNHFYFLKKEEEEVVTHCQVEKVLWALLFTLKIKQQQSLLHRRLFSIKKRASLSLTLLLSIIRPSSPFYTHTDISGEEKNSLLYSRYVPAVSRQRQRQRQSWVRGVDCIESRWPLTPCI